ncbi:hypothetical protein LCGC14_3140680 [marine sediment metagenome]|uniref:Uncharacterized protein n=1 Tax=marine sediment metagenome TaxID=412755 RepID=A0A0F8YLC7_9ZZZZ
MTQSSTFRPSHKEEKYQGVAQLGSALGSDPRGRQFDSGRPDQFEKEILNDWLSYISSSNSGVARLNGLVVAPDMV